MSTLLLYEVVSDHAERRKPLREEHLRLVEEAHERGDLVLAGAHTDEAGTIEGAVLVFASDDFSIAEAFARADPYVTNGLVTRYRVRKWSIVAGKLVQTPR